MNSDINILLIFELKFYFTKHYVIDKPHSFAAQLLKQTRLYDKQKKLMDNNQTDIFSFICFVPLFI